MPLCIYKNNLNIGVTELLSTLDIKICLIYYIFFSH